MFLNLPPKLILKMAAFDLTSQISELDYFNLDTSFEDFIKQTQHKLLTMPVLQSEGEQSTVPNYDISLFMAINFDASEEKIKEYSVVKEVGTELT